MPKSPTPDQHGRYRVRRKDDPESPAWSTFLYDPDEHVIAPGLASDTYGNAWPPKYSRRHESETPPGDIPSPDPDNKEERAE